MGAAAYAAACLALTWASLRRLPENGFDAATFCQALWRFNRGDGMLTTLHDTPAAVSVLGEHFMPVLYAFAPIFRLFPGPAALAALHVAGLALGALPLYALAAEALGPEGGAWIALAYLASPPTTISAANVFAPESFSAALFLAAVWAQSRGKDAAYAALALAAISCRETNGLVAAALALVLWRRARTPRLHAALAAFGAAWFAVCVFWIEPRLGFGDPFGPLGLPRAAATTTLAFARAHAAATALELARRCLDAGKWLHFARWLAPAAFLPLAEPVWLIPAAPPAAMLLASSSRGLLGVAATWYLFPAYGFFFVAAAAAIAARPRWRTLGPRVVFACSLWSYLLFSPRLLGGYLAAALAPGRHSRAAPIRAAAALIPPDASVSAFDRALTILYARKRLYRYPWKKDEADFVLIDALADPGRADAAALREKGFFPVFSREGILLLGRERR